MYIEVIQAVWSSMRIFFDPDTLHQSKMGSVTGVVYFEFSPDRHFPSVGWNDFVVVLATWWMAALEKLVEGQSKVDFLFVDGPYWITATFQGTCVLLQCTQDRRGADLPYEVVVQMDDLKRQLLTFARNASAACKGARIQSTDLDGLRRLLPN